MTLMHTRFKTTTRLSTGCLVMVAGLAACSPATEQHDEDAGADQDAASRQISVTDPATELQLRLLEAQPGDTILLPAGTFNFERGLTLNVDNITLRGAGMDSTVLSFKNQLAGGEGLLVNGSGFTIERGNGNYGQIWQIKKDRLAGRSQHSGG